jgi:uncharacterized protein GlcG (DUF336 family)
MPAFTESAGNRRNAVFWAPTQATKHIHKRRLNRATQLKEEFMFSKKSMVIATALACASFGAVAQQAYVSQRSISYEAAHDASVVALEVCRKNGYKVTVTVVDAAGGTKIVLHDDGARPHTIENSMRKAYTSLTSGRTSGEYGKLNVANPQSVGALHLDRITTLEGALPIKSGNEVIGAIGVSGAPGGDKDAVCAQAGIDKISKGL